MEPDDYIEDHDENIPNYREPSEIGAAELGQALATLPLLGDDPFLRIQAFDLSIVDHFITDLERKLQRRRFDEEDTRGDDAFLSAQTQMWMFAVYELLRTWRARAKAVVKLANNGGLTLKAEALGRKQRFSHPAREMRARQLRDIIREPALIGRIGVDLRRTHVLFRQLEHVRVTLAKHEISGKPNAVPHAPGVATINRWCGSFEYEIGYEGAILDTLCRRDIAEALRALPAIDDVSEEDIASFDEFMKGPPADFWDELDPAAPEPQKATRKRSG